MRPGFALTLIWSQIPLYSRVKAEVPTLAQQQHERGVVDPEVVVGNPEEESAIESNNDDADLCSCTPQIGELSPRTRNSGASREKRHDCATGNSCDKAIGDSPVQVGHSSKNENDVKFISFPLTPDNLAALGILGSLCCLGCLYLVNICSSFWRKCHCKSCCGEYRDLRRVGGGGFGEVYLCERTSDMKKFIMKKIVVEDITRADSYAVEAKRLTALRHRYIVAYEDDFLHTISFNTKYLFVIIMEFCPAGDLKDFIEDWKNRQFFDEAQILQWFCQLCQAVHYLHEKNVIHRDIKSQNVFLTGNGDVRLGDFGLSRFAQQLDRCATTTSYSGDTISDSMSHAGTESYMAPEILNSKQYGKPADVWALGCVLLEMCSGTFMWELDYLLGVSVENDPRAISQLVEGLPSRIPISIKTMLKRILQANPAQRPTLPELLRKRFLKRNLKKQNGARRRLSSELFSIRSNFNSTTAISKVNGISVNEDMPTVSPAAVAAPPLDQHKTKGRTRKRKSASKLVVLAQDPSSNKEMSGYRVNETRLPSIS